MARTSAALVLLLSLIGLSPGTGTAQESAWIGAGRRVRVLIPEGQPYAHSLTGQQVSSGGFVSGTLSTATDSLMVLTDTQTGSELRVPKASIEAAQAFAGQKRHTVDGLLLGGAIGGITGLILGLREEGSPPTCSFLCTSTGESAFLYGIGLGGIGVVVGGVVGALIKTDRWEDVPLSGFKASIQVGEFGGIGFEFTIPAGLIP